MELPIPGVNHPPVQHAEEWLQQVNLGHCRTAGVVARASYPHFTTRFGLRPIFWPVKGSFGNGRTGFQGNLTLMDLLSCCLQF
ncbi:hypothetical protein DPEC_G00242440 [Dallia pectoralis]|uniref:Uncharacterized protein n=1 Tax=Dallia pectoralis TaxID=75939 RepID=A0ACC2FVA6_DALPE|nr:hypothetical protein DPEC_G00242440 [Dallia pectoralis]